MLQSILFNKAYFTKQETLQWLIKHKYRPYKIHEIENFYRFRMASLPKGCCLSLAEQG